MYKQDPLGRPFDERSLIDRIFAYPFLSHEEGETTDKLQHVNLRTHLNQEAGAALETRPTQQRTINHPTRKADNDQDEDDADRNGRAIVVTMVPFKTSQQIARDALVADAAKAVAFLKLHPRILKDLSPQVVVDAAKGFYAELVEEFELFTQAKENGKGDDFKFKGCADEKGNISNDETDDAFNKTEEETVSTQLLVLPALKEEVMPPTTAQSPTANVTGSPLQLQPNLDGNRYEPEKDDEHEEGGVDYNATTLVFGNTMPPPSSVDEEKQHSPSEQQDHHEAIENDIQTELSISEQSVVVAPFDPNTTMPPVADDANPVMMAPPVKPPPPSVKLPASLLRRRERQHAVHKTTTTVADVAPLVLKRSPVLVMGAPVSLYVPTTPKKNGQTDSKSKRTGGVGGGGTTDDFIPMSQEELELFMLMKGEEDALRKEKQAKERGGDKADADKEDERGGLVKSHSHFYINKVPILVNRDVIDAARHRQALQYVLEFERRMLKTRNREDRLFAIQEAKRREEELAAKIAKEERERFLLQSLFCVPFAFQKVFKPVMDRMFSEKQLSRLCGPVFLRFMRRKKREIMVKRLLHAARVLPMTRQSLPCWGQSQFHDYVNDASETVQMSLYDEMDSNNSPLAALSGGGGARDVSRRPLPASAVLPLLAMDARPPSHAVITGTVDNITRQRGASVGGGGGNVNSFVVSNSGSQSLTMAVDNSQNASGSTLINSSGKLFAKRSAAVATDGKGPSPSIACKPPKNVSRSSSASSSASSSLRRRSAKGNKDKKRGEGVEAAEEDNKLSPSSRWTVPTQLVPPDGGPSHRLFAKWSPQTLQSLVSRMRPHYYFAGEMLFYEDAARNEGSSSDEADDEDAQLRSLMMAGDENDNIESIAGRSASQSKVRPLPPPLLTNPSRSTSARRVAGRRVSVSTSAAGMAPTPTLGSPLIAPSAVSRDDGAYSRSKLHSAQTDRYTSDGRRSSPLMTSNSSRSSRQQQQRTASPSLFSKVLSQQEARRTARSQRLRNATLSGRGGVQRVVRVGRRPIVPPSVIDTKMDSMSRNGSPNRQAEQKGHHHSSKSEAAATNGPTRLASFISIGGVTEEIRASVGSNHHVNANAAHNLLFKEDWSQSDSEDSCLSDDEAVETTKKRRGTKLTKAARRRRHKRMSQKDVQSHGSGAQKCTAWGIGSCNLDHVVLIAAGDVVEYDANALRSHLARREVLREREALLEKRRQQEEDAVAVHPQQRGRSNHYDNRPSMDSNVSSTGSGGGGKADRLANPFPPLAPLPPVPIAYHRAGSVIGALQAATGCPFTRNVRCETDVVAYRISVKKFLEFIAVQPVASAPATSNAVTSNEVLLPNATFEASRSPPTLQLTSNTANNSSCGGGGGGTSHLGRSFVYISKADKHAHQLAMNSLQSFKTDFMTAAKALCRQLFAKTDERRQVRDIGKFLLQKQIQLYANSNSSSSADRQKQLNLMGATDANANSSSPPSSVLFGTPFTEFKHKPMAYVASLAEADAQARKAAAMAVPDAVLSLVPTMGIVASTFKNSHPLFQLMPDGLVNSLRAEITRLVARPFEVIAADVHDSPFLHIVRRGTAVMVNTRDAPAGPPITAAYTRAAADAQAAAAASWHPPSVVVSSTNVKELSDIPSILTPNSKEKAKKDDKTEKDDGSNVLILKPTFVEHDDEEAAQEKTSTTAATLDANTSSTTNQPASKRAKKCGAAHLASGPSIKLSEVVAPVGKLIGMDSLIAWDVDNIRPCPSHTPQSALLLSHATQLNKIATSRVAEAPKYTSSTTASANNQKSSSASAAAAAASASRHAMSLWDKMRRIDEQMAVGSSSSSSATDADEPRPPQVQSSSSLSLVEGTPNTAAPTAAAATTMAALPHQVASKCAVTRTSLVANTYVEFYALPKESLLKALRVHNGMLQNVRRVAAQHARVCAPNCQRLFQGTANYGLNGRSNGGNATTTNGGSAANTNASIGLASAHASASVAGAKALEGSGAMALKAAEPVFSFLGNRALLSLAASFQIKVTLPGEKIMSTASLVTVGGKEVTEEEQADAKPKGLGTPFVDPADDTHQLRTLLGGAYKPLVHTYIVGSTTKMAVILLHGTMEQIFKVTPPLLKPTKRPNDPNTMTTGSSEAQHSSPGKEAAKRNSVQRRGSMLLQSLEAIEEASSERAANSNSRGAAGEGSSHTKANAAASSSLIISQQNKRSLFRYPWSFFGFSETLTEQAVNYDLVSVGSCVIATISRDRLLEAILMSSTLSNPRLISNALKIRAMGNATNQNQSNNGDANIDDDDDNPQRQAIARERSSAIMMALADADDPLVFQLLERAELIAMTQKRAHERLWAPNTLSPSTLSPPSATAITAPQTNLNNQKRPSSHDGASSDASPATSRTSSPARPTKLNGAETVRLLTVVVSPPQSPSSSPPSPSAQRTHRYSRSSLPSLPHRSSSNAHGASSANAILARAVRNNSSTMTPAKLSAEVNAAAATLAFTTIAEQIEVVTASALNSGAFGADATNAKGEANKSLFPSLASGSTATSGANNSTTSKYVPQDPLLATIEANATLSAEQRMLKEARERATQRAKEKAEQEKKAKAAAAEEERRRELARKMVKEKKTREVGIKERMGKVSDGTHGDILSAGLTSAEERALVDEMAELMAYNSSGNQALANSSSSGSKNSSKKGKPAKETTAAGSEVSSKLSQYLSSTTTRYEGAIRELYYRKIKKDIEDSYQTIRAQAEKEVEERYRLKALKASANSSTQHQQQQQEASSTTTGGVAEAEQGAESSSIKKDFVDNEALFLATIEKYLPEVRDDYEGGADMNDLTGTAVRKNSTFEPITNLLPTTNAATTEAGTTTNIAVPRDALMKTLSGSSVIPAPPPPPPLLTISQLFPSIHNNSLSSRLGANSTTTTTASDRNSNFGSQSPSKSLRALPNAPRADEWHEEGEEEERSIGGEDDVSEANADDHQEEEDPYLARLRAIVEADKRARALPPKRKSEIELKPKDALANMLMMQATPLPLFANPEQQARHQSSSLLLSFPRAPSVSARHPSLAFGLSTLAKDAQFLQSARQSNAVVEQRNSLMTRPQVGSQQQYAISNPNSIPNGTGVFAANNANDDSGDFAGRNSGHHSSSRVSTTGPPLAPTRPPSSAIPEAAVPPEALTPPVRPPQHYRHSHFIPSLDDQPLFEKRPKDPISVEAAKRRLEVERRVSDLLLGGGGRRSVPFTAFPPPSPLSPPSRRHTSSLSTPVSPRTASTPRGSSSTVAPSLAMSARSDQVTSLHDSATTTTSSSPPRNMSEDESSWRTRQREQQRRVKGLTTRH